MRTSRQELAEMVETLARAEFEGSRLGDRIRDRTGWKDITRHTKQVFGDLGNRLGYQVAASGYASAMQGEWLYDMCWFASQDGVMTELALALETEMMPGGPVLRAAEVDDDFMKLVQARAQVRVWLTLIPNADLAAQHVANCKRQAEGFAGAQAGDTYVFIIYDWTTRQTLVERFEAETVAAVPEALPPE